LRDCQLPTAYCRLPTDWLSGEVVNTSVFGTFKRLFLFKFMSFF